MALWKDELKASQRRTNQLYGDYRGRSADITAGAKRLGETGRDQDYLDYQRSITSKPPGFSQGVLDQTAALPTTRGGGYNSLLSQIVSNNRYDPNLKSFASDTLQHGGFSPAVVSALHQEGQGQIDPIISGARQNITRSATMTGRNDAGIPAALGKLGRDEATLRSDVLRRQLMDIEGEGFNRKLVGAGLVKDISDSERGRDVQGLGLVGENEDEQLRRILARLGLQMGQEETARGQGIENLRLMGEPQEFELQNFLKSLGIMSAQQGTDASMISNNANIQAQLASRPSIWRSIIPALISGGAQLASGGLFGGGGGGAIRNPGDPYPSS